MQNGGAHRALHFLQDDAGRRECATTATADGIVDRLACLMRETYEASVLADSAAAVSSKTPMRRNFS